MLIDVVFSIRKRTTVQYLFKIYFTSGINVVDSVVKSFVRPLMDDVGVNILSRTDNNIYLHFDTARCFQRLFVRAYLGPLVSVEFTLFILILFERVTKRKISVAKF